MPLETTIEKMIAAFLTWFETNQDLTVAIVFLFGFAESIVLLAFLVPSSVVFAAIGATYAASGGSVELLWMYGALGAVLGDAVSFGMGRHFREDAKSVWPLNRYPALFARARSVFDRWGWFAIVASKFTFGLRPFVPVAAGIWEMPFRSFMAASLVSSVLWAGAALGSGYATATALISLFD